jgi:ArsR family transcriptional regulator
MYVKVFKGRSMPNTLVIDQANDVLACCAPLARAPLTAEAAIELAGILKAIADPTRLRLLSLIQAHEGGEACVCDLTEPVGLTQPTISHHLRVLLEAGLVTRSKRGTWAYFRAVPDRLAALASVISESA